jgi:hypothetical protein
MFRRGANLDVSVIGNPAKSAPDKRSPQTGFLATVPVTRVGTVGLLIVVLLTKTGA